MDPFNQTIIEPHKGQPIVIVNMKLMSFIIISISTIGIAKARLEVKLKLLYSRLPRINHGVDQNPMRFPDGRVVTKDVVISIA